MLVEMPCDIRGFDFAAFEASKAEYQRHGRSSDYYNLLRASAGGNHPLPAIWKKLRERLAGYSFGRFELVPIRTNPEGMSRYLEKYLSKGLSAKRADGRRVRLWAIKRSAPRVVKMPFAWVSSGARLWRMKVGMVAERFHCRNLDEISGLFGPRWAYHLKDLIAALIPAEMTCPQRIRQSAMLGSVGMLSSTITYTEGVAGSEQAHFVGVRGGDGFDAVHVYDRDSWNELIFRAIAAKTLANRKTRARFAA